MHNPSTRRARKFFALAFTCLGVGGLLTPLTYASDHNESPLVKRDASMDLTDLYVFESAPGKTTAIVNWGGFNDSRPQPDAEGLYTKNSLYTINIDNNEDNVPDLQIQWRFGQNGAGKWGVQVQGVPGSSGTISGPVETVLRGGNGTQVWTGHADDPFFFDVQGYLDTLATGTLHIQNGATILDGLNVTSFAVEFNNVDVVRPGNELRFWIQSARK